jgi:FkbM family methyltransferase
MDRGESCNQPCTENPSWAVLRIKAPDASPFGRWIRAIYRGTGISTTARRYLNIISFRRFTVDWRGWALRRVMIPYVRIPYWITTREGARFYLSDDPADDMILANLCDRFVDVYYPRLPGPIEEGSIILDVGAHHGFYAVEVLRRYRWARLIAIEPNPNSCRLIGENLAANHLLHRAEIVEAGIGDKLGTALLEKGKSGSEGDRTVTVEAPQDHADQTLVRTLPIRDILRERLPYMVKCNAEGAEYMLFPQLFSMGVFPKVVVLMLHPKYGSSIKLLELFVRSGYKIEDIGSRLGRSRGEVVHCWLRSGC